MELRALLLLLLCFPALQAQIPHVEKRQREGSTLQIQCSYTQEADQRKKAWCRMTNGLREILVETRISRLYPYTIQNTKGKATIDDNKTYRTMYVSMTNLQVEDSGTYACAYLSHSYTYHPLKTISLNVFRAIEAITSVTEERRSEGSTLQILCPYNAQLDLHKKAWCRVRGDECELLGEMLDPTQRPYRTRVTEGNIAIEDHFRNRTVSITMTNLQVEDSGTYACASHLYSRYLALKAIALRVFKELKKSELDRLSVQCSYSKLEYERDTKAWCRREEQDKCNPVARTDFSPTPRNIKDLVARSSIQDDTRNRTITITVEKLQAQDSGMYWCARYVAPAPTWIMEVSLSVSKKTQQLTAQKKDDVSVRCWYSIPDYGAVSKAWCREGKRGACTLLATTNQESSRNHWVPQQGRVRIQDDTQQGVVTITMKKLQAQDSGVYWCALDEEGQLFRMEEVTLNVSEELSETTSLDTNQASPPGSTPATSSNVNTFILISGLLSVLFILALISLTTLFVRRRKQKKRRGNRQEEHTYSQPEDITQLHSSKGMESPKDDSKDVKYATLNFKPRPSPEDPLYCNIEPSQAPRKPEDEGVEYAVIALKQLPTNNKG